MLRDSVAELRLHRDSLSAACCFASPLPFPRRLQRLV